MKTTSLILAAMVTIMLASCNQNGSASSDDSADSTSTEAVNTESADDAADANDATAKLTERDMLWTELHKAFDVKGGVGIKSFVNATLDALTGGYEFGEEDDVTFDEKNGYFAYFEEGDGSCRYRGSYWKRDDGSQLFIISYQLTEYTPENQLGKAGEISSVWGYTSNRIETVGEDGEESIYRFETGFCAWIYDAQQKRLLPLDTPPIDGWTALSEHRFLDLPQHGKNIEMLVGQPGEEPTTETLEWNGMGFN